MPGHTGSAIWVFEVQTHEMIGCQVVNQEHGGFTRCLLREDEDLVDEGATWGEA